MNETTTQQHSLLHTAKLYLVGGVNSPVRAFKQVGMEPLLVRKAEGAYITDESGRQLIDLVCGWGTLILGHRHPVVRDAVLETLNKLILAGFTTRYEVALAEKIVSLYPGIEKVRFVNSGTEAVLSAVRLARAVTGKNRIIKFDGCYHGHADTLLVRAGSGAMGLPSTAGIPPAVVRDTLLARYNDLTSVEVLFHAYEDIAAVIVEPVAGNMGVVVPDEEFIQGLRTLTTRHGALLIFDEVITGFRVGLDGCAGKWSVKPDIVCFGKIIGGGFPVGAYAAPSWIMNRVAPQGDVYQAGTLAGHPVAMSAGLATLSYLEEKMPYQQLEERTAVLARTIKELFLTKGIAVQVNHFASMFSIFFTHRQVRTLEDVNCSDTEMFAKVYRLIFEEGVLLPPSPYEACFLSVAHDDGICEQIVEKIQRALRRL